MNNEILGGVSPLKQRQRSRGGSNARTATSTSSRRGGFAASKGKRGGGGRNVGGYNVQTRFKASKWTPPASGGTMIVPSKPYSYDPEGNMQVDPMATKKYTDAVPGSTTTEKTLKKSKSGKEIGTWNKDDHEGKGPTWAQAWDNNLENVQDKYDTLEDYKAEQRKIKSGETKGASKEDIDKSIYDEKTVTKDKVDGFWTYYDENGGEISKKEYSKYKNKQ